MTAKVLAHARSMRAVPTDAERRLWSKLRYRQVEGLRFRRQAPIGPIIADFVCFSNLLIIEVDGGQHAEQEEQDKARTTWLESQGFRVMRFWSNDVLANTEGVLETISQFVLEDRAFRQQQAPHPNPPPQGGRG